MLEFTKVFYALFLDPWKSLRDVDSISEKEHKSPVITDAKSLYDALERSEPSTRNLTERRSSRSHCNQTTVGTWIHLKTGWVNSDKQMADGLTKPQAAWKLLEIMSAGKWTSFGARLSRVQENSRWQNGQKGKEILMGEEFSMIILLYHVAF